MILLTRTPYTPPPYAWMEENRALMEGTTEASYKASVANLKGLSGMDVSAITYDSDGLAVTGVEVLPQLNHAERVPLLIYNRGGSGNYGMLSPGQITVLMAPFVQRMRVGVLASNYRGNGGSEGQEQFGGADVADVLNLIALGKSQPWWDGKNIFMLGWSRGGMMTCQAMAEGAQLSAAAIGAGLFDAAANLAARPPMERVFNRFIAGFEQSREEVLRVRSAVCWPEKITAPLLIMHGDADAVVDVAGARELYAKLDALGRDVKYVEYVGGDHALRKHWKLWMEETVRWFEAHRVASSADVASHVS